MKTIPRKRVCPSCGTELEKDEEYVYGQYAFEEGPISRVPLHEYPWCCTNTECEKVWQWDRKKGKWVES